MKFKILIAFAAIILSACAPAEPTSTVAPRATPARTAISAELTPTTDTQPGSANAPTASPASPYALYDDKAAPFTIQYPRGWTIREEPESIFFTAPDETGALQVITYEYQEGAPKNLTAKDVLNNFSQNFLQGTGFKLIQQAINADSSISVNVEYTDASKRAQQGMVRVTLAKSRRYHFIVLFSANKDQFARWKPMGTTVIESFRER